MQHNITSITDNTNPVELNVIFNDLKYDEITIIINIVKNIIKEKYLGFILKIIFV